tara:strand:- start:1481 stop:2683 length:1203 start_codon:yes stop_codon:yes gene_type:complete
MHTRRLVFLNFLLLFSAIFFGLLPSQANAQGRSQDIFERFKKPMPKLKLLTDEEFLEVTKPVEKEPYGDESLAYSMRIDKTWEDGVDRSSSNSVLSEKLFLELNSFLGKPTIAGRSRIEVQGLNMEGNLTAEQWYIRYILESGYTTEGFITHNVDKVESLMVVMEKDYSYYLRTLVMINGAKVIMVKYYVSIHYIQEQAVMQAMVLSSFNLTNKKERVFDSMVSYRFLDIAEFKYPPNWRVYAKPVRNVDRLDVTLLNMKEVAGPAGSVASSTTEGKLDVTVVSSAVKNTLVEEINDYKKKIESEGMLVGEKLKENYDFKYADNIDFGLTEVYKGIDSADNLSEYEFWFTVLVGGNYYYFIMLLTPSRNESFATWADNSQNYKLMLAEFKPMVGAFLERD